MATLFVLALNIPQYLNKDKFLFLQNIYFSDNLFRIIFNTLFGLSTSFWFAISVRFLLGCVNCLLGVIRAYASEVASEEYHALCLSVVSTSRGIGLIIGPAIGGYLAQLSIFSAELSYISLCYSLQKNTPNSDGGSDGHQYRRTFVTEYRTISDEIQKFEVVGIPSAISDGIPTKQGSSEFSDD
ncbi:hypothetical protein HID58_080432, partial [Brassica napus]